MDDHHDPHAQTQPNVMDCEEPLQTVIAEAIRPMSARGGPRLGHPWPSKDRKYSTRWDRTIDTNTS